MTKYVHGYTTRENQRLHDQSYILEELLHGGTAYPPGSRVLEAGCGVGAQTIVLSRRNPGTQITSIDFCADSVAKARILARENGLTNVHFLECDILNLPFAAGEFDHVFVCFVLEHIDSPIQALASLKKVLRVGGTLTVIEGDHASAFWHPETPASLKVWRSLVQAQAELGHDPLIGRRLYSLLNTAGYHVEYVAPRWIYADGGDPKLLDGLVNKIMVPMVETAKDRAMDLGLVDPETWRQGIGDLALTGIPPDGSYFYTWFKARALKAGD